MQTSSTQKTRYGKPEVIGTAVVDFGVKDSKGRAVGFWVRREKRVYIPVAEDATSYWNHDAGTFFLIIGIASRDGDPFGSADSRVEAPTLEEAEAEFAKRLERARKVAIKKWAKQPA